MGASKQKEKVKSPITPKSTDFSRWYLDVIREADLAEYAPVKGCIVFKPHGYAIWENIQNILDQKFKETGVENAYFPLLIPERFLKREKEHVEGFSPEVAAVMYAGGERLKEALIIRPTSETIIYPIIAGWIKSHRDLPLLLNQWANVVRWEKRPRPFIRTTEFLWQEGHTAHASESEADERARLMLDVYKDFAESFMAIPVITGVKSESEKFAGALQTYTVEAMMQDGKALQFSTSHNLGQNFSKAFGIEFTDQDGSSRYCWQTSWGLSTRTIGALVMVHGDDKGLVIPPKVAPVKVAIVPIWDEESRTTVGGKVSEVVSALHNSGLGEVKFDDREDINPGDKYYFWERKGVPLRIEIGPRDVQKESVVFVRRDTGEKFDVKIKDVAESVKHVLVEIQDELYRRALSNLKENTVSVDDWDDFKRAIRSRKFVLAHWCGDAEAEEKIKEETKATIRCVPFDQPEEKGRCILTKKPSKRRVLFAQSY
ncbi:MAG: proline--tRNA ligase [Patescibacteria group bacterium]